MVVLAGCSPSAPAAPSEGHVFVIVMENKSPDEALQGAFTAEVAASEGVAADYRAVAHPSIPNYLALTSGQTWGVTDDSYHVLPREDIGDELTRAGVSWRAYMEGLGGGGCINSPLPYDPGHNPFAFYGGACPSNVVPFARLGADLGAATPRFSWIGPDQCHDEHSCSVPVGDQWQRQTVQSIEASPAWTRGSVLFITWDEDDGKADNRVLTLVVTPLHRHVVSEVAYDHYSLLATIEDLTGVPRLANAKSAARMTDLIS